MNMTDEFLRLMRTQREIALATSADNTPHVRIVNFIYVPEEGRIYFATFADNAKVSEIAANPAVSFTTIPHDGSTAHVRAVGRAVRSERSIFEYADAFAAKRPSPPSAVNCSSTRSHSIRRPSPWTWSAAGQFASRLCQTRRPILAFLCLFLVLAVHTLYNRINNRIEGGSVYANDFHVLRDHHSHV